MGQARSDEAGLGDAVGRQRGIGLALEATLDDERRLAVPDEDERRVEPVGDEAAGVAAGCRPGGRQRSVPSRIVHRSMTES